MWYQREPSPYNKSHDEALEVHDFGVGTDFHLPKYMEQCQRHGREHCHSVLTQPGRGNGKTGQEFGGLLLFFRS